MEVPLQVLKSAASLVLCIRAEVSELLAHDEWRVGFFPIKKDILCVQIMGQNNRSRGNRGTDLYVTNDWCL